MSPALWDRQPQAWKSCDRGLELPEATKAPLLQAFLDPRPQVAAGRVLAQHHLATTLIDLSDGVASDLYQICLQSQVGAVVEAAQVPIPPAVIEVAITDRQRHRLTWP